MLNSKMLKGKLIERGVTVSDMARYLDINQSTFYRKMKNNSFRISETDIMVKVLNLSVSEANKIFFAQIVA